MEICAGIDLPSTTPQSLSFNVSAPSYPHPLPLPPHSPSLTPLPILVSTIVPTTSRPPAPIPPPMNRPPHSKAQDLPYGPLANVFTHLCASGQVQGGDMVDWTSNNHIAPLSLVCRGWWLPSRTTLYHSVAIRGAQQARLFLRALEGHPEMAHAVRSLVVGLEDISSEDEREELEASEVLGQVIKACPSLQQLQVRPLHDVARPAVLAAIASCPLSSLILAPRLSGNGSKWALGLWPALNSSHSTLATLRHLEIDYWSHLPPMSTNFCPSFPGLALETISLACDIPANILLPLLDQTSSTLSALDVYSEEPLLTDTVTESLSRCTRFVTHMSFVRNLTNDLIESFDDTVPLFDRLLPHFEVLDTLSLAATDVSCQLFRLLPSCVRELEVQSLNPASLFYFDQQLLDDLHDPSLPIYLQSLTVKDTSEVWSAQDVKTFGYECSRRGINFTFVADAAYASDTDEMEETDETDETDDAMSTDGSED